ncbi:MAG: FAD-dependent thymidylate synthase [Thermodesulfobacteria bacterium]|nr:FAD-dependent thymidylate synthase [Thermodesulfobacteriota bacterium]
MQLEFLKSSQRELIQKVIPLVDEELLSPFLFFSYLGARICYASTHPLKLFYEERFKNHQKFVEFLLHLKKMGHFSVFAHTPVFVKHTELTLEDKFNIAKNFFKVFWEEEVILFNLRHFAETLTLEQFNKYINKKVELEEVTLRVYRSWKKCFEGDFVDLPQDFLEESESVFAEPEVIIIEIKKEHNPKWIGVIAHNFSRIFSHQFVRHTWLNFNQRSHRYTKVDKFVIPSTFEKGDVIEYEKIIKSAMKLYENLSKKMKRESARFVVPQGVATTVLATGCELVWKDFVTKRAIPQAQEEIRKLAEILKLELGL